jgi:hypothetical protein
MSFTLLDLQYRYIVNTLFLDAVKARPKNRGKGDYQ